MKNQLVLGAKAAANRETTNNCALSHGEAAGPGASAARVLLQLPVGRTLRLQRARRCLANPRRPQKRRVRQR